MDIADCTDRELVSALRILISEFSVRHALAGSELWDALEQLVRTNAIDALCVQLIEDPGSHEIVEALSQAGAAYALLTGRGDRDYTSHSQREHDMLIRSGFWPRPPVPISEPEASRND